MPYTYQTLAQVRQALAQRLSQPNPVFWSVPELNLYINEALQTWNAITGYWASEFEFTYVQPGTGNNWINASTITGSPRPYVQRNVDLYSIILYHLLEPQIAADGITWQGTSQFQFTDLIVSLERRVNEILVMAGCNIVRPLPINLTPNTRVITLPDNVLDVRRYKWVPYRTPTDFGPPQLLWRGDLASFSYFSAGYLQNRQNPRNYTVTEIPPLTIEVDFPAPVPAIADLLVIQGVSNPAPPTALTIPIPTDWVWALKWGILMDLLYKQSEARDTVRAEYCKARYIEAIGLLNTAPWLVAANIENVPVHLESVMERDQFNVNWENNRNARQGVVVAGMDTFAVVPVQGVHPSTGVVLSIVQNAPLPVNDTDNVQVPRDVLSVILDYAEHLAMFKCGGEEFTATIPLFDNFRKSVSVTSRRQDMLGLYQDQMQAEGKRQDTVDARN